MKAGGKLCVSRRGHAPDGEALLHGRWSAHQSPLFLFVQASKGILVSLGKKKTHTQSNAAVCQRAPGGRYSSLRSQNFIMNPAETCAPEQTSCRSKVPKLRSSKMLFWFFFCSGWAYIMIQMKMIRMCLIVIIRRKACVLQSWKIWTYFLQAKWL